MDDSLEELEKSVIKSIEVFEASEKLNTNCNKSPLYQMQEEKNSSNSFNTLNKSTNRVTIFTKDEINFIDSNKTFDKVSNVVKELIENSIDADAKCISVLIQNGGLDKIEITDDGRGIPVLNFKNLCKRYTTNKASDYERDMKTLKTLGYRGEALSILSYNSTLKITSRHWDSDFGYEVTYKNGNVFLKNFYARNSLKNNSDIRNRVDYKKCTSGNIDMNISNRFLNFIVQKT